MDFSRECARIEQHKVERRTHMRKLWVKAWITLDGVFDADTMEHWWHASDSAERRQYIMEEYSPSGLCKDASHEQGGR
jgi:hypothetical protein